MADERVRASSSSSSLFTLNRPKGLQKSKPHRLAEFCPISSKFHYRHGSACPFTSGFWFILLPESLWATK